MPLNDFLSPYGAVKHESGTAKTASVATLAALKALAATDPAHVHGNVVLVDADGRLIIDTDESGMVAAVLVMAAAIEKVESWVAERDAAQLGEPPPLLVSDRDIFAAEQHAAVYISPAIGAFGRASR